MLPRRSLVAAVLVFIVAREACRAESPRRPNILWIVAENIGHEPTCFGGTNVKTPNIDRLAVEGVRYTNVFATAPVCSASRSAFLVGMYQTTTGTHHARSHRDDAYQLPGGARAITYRLRDAGYWTANIKHVPGANGVPQVVGTGKVDLNFDVGPKLYDTDDWTTLTARQPFFAMVNTPEVEMDIYDRQTWKKDRVEWVGEREHEQIALPENVSPPPYYPDHTIVRQEWARYLNSVSGLDHRVGAVLRQLELDGTADNTIVLFFADNGRLEPRGIHWCYDSGLRVPLVIRFPKNFPPPDGWKPGTVDASLVSLLDLTATTVALAGIPKSTEMQSRNFLGPNADPPRSIVFSARDRIDESEQRIRTARNERYRYIRNFRPDQPLTALNRYKEKCFAIVPLMRALHAEGKLDSVQAALMTPRLPDEELYDLTTDPYEIRNLAASSDPEHRRVLVELRTAVEQWIVETDDQGRFPEPREIVARFAKEMHDWFGTPDWARQTD